MALHRRVVFLGLFLAGLATGCAQTEAQGEKHPGRGEGKVIKVPLVMNLQEETQKALISAKPGDTIEFGPGTYEFSMGLSLAVENVTIRGQGMEKTILSFKKQDAGKEGLLVTRGKFTLEDLTIQDTKGDGVKINDVDGVTFRRVKTEWTGGSKESNGAYGLYPVQCKNVLIDECVAIGASDAGIYVGQSQNIIVRKCRAEGNVAGIEIENSLDADVYENVATNNAGGLLVFDLPGLQVKNGGRVRVFDNKVFANNHANFAPKGNMVATVAPGTGMMIMATDQVEMFQNTVKDNKTYGLLVISFYVTGRPIEDKAYDPIPEGVFVHDNKFSDCGTDPQGERAKMLMGLLGKPLPDMIYDGIENPKNLADGKLPPDKRLYIDNNGKATFANLHWKDLDPMDLGGNLKKVTRDLHPYEGKMAALPAVTLPGVK